METRTYSIQGQSFCLQPITLNVKKYGARLLARIRKLAYEYTKDTDFSVIDKYNEQRQELITAKNQFQGLIDSGVDEQGYELTYEKKLHYIKKINECDIKLSGIDKEQKNNPEVGRALKLKTELEKCAMIELITDADFLKDVLRKLLTGGNIYNIDFSRQDTQKFIIDVIYDFFCLMSGNGLK